jgi:hypothetical protein
MNQFSHLPTEKIIEIFQKKGNDATQCFLADIIEELTQRKQKLQRELVDLGVNPMTISAPHTRENLIQALNSLRNIEQIVP